VPHVVPDDVLWGDIAKLRELATGRKKGAGEGAVGLAAPEGLW
jgi:hypothetical protein